MTFKEGEDGGREVKLTPEEWEKLMLPPKLKRGQMPTPEFLNIQNPFPDKTGKPIGIMAFSCMSDSADIELKPFIWLKNIGGDLTNEAFREDIACALTVLKMREEGLDLAAGPAISLRKSDPKTGKVKKIFHPGNTIGIYVNSTTELWPSDLKKRINNLFSAANVIEGGLLGARNQDRFEEILGLTKMLLPRPVGNYPKR